MKFANVKTRRLTKELNAAWPLADDQKNAKKVRLA